jgi:uridylate kinase
VILSDFDIILKPREQLVVAAGWRPGWSTDYCAVMLCDDYDARMIVNMSNIDTVFDKDPREFPDAKPLTKIEWSEFQPIVGDQWKPGMNAPFDPIASKRASEMGVTVVVLNGRNLDNLQNYFAGKSFTGTVIG